MNTEEKLLRENVRRAIKIVQKRRKEIKDQALLEERMLRSVIRKLIKEDADAPSASTAINVLQELLKKIIPVLEEDFKSLTTGREQRDSFRAHVVNAIENLLAPAEINAEADDEDPLEELLQKINEINISVGDDDPPEFIDIYGDEEEPNQEEPDTEEEKFAKGLEDKEYNLVGRNMALRALKRFSKTF